MPPVEPTLDRRQWLGLSLAAPMAASLGALAWPVQALAQAVVKVDGVDVPTATTVRGKKLVLNGAGVRRRGYYKSNIVALYLPERLTTLDAIMKLDGPRRIQMLLLRDFSQSTVSRIFLADFKQATTDTEFKTLINEVAEIGAIYNNVKRVEQGDKVNIDWQPGAGIIASLNDRQLNEKPINNELAYQIYLRMFMGPTVPEELRNRLLGLGNG
jgi:Chalcone isomerase-like